MVSIVFSIFLDKYSNVQFRNDFGNKLGLGALGYEENGKEFLWACKNGQADLVETMLRSSDGSVLNYTDTDDSDKSGLHFACDNKKFEVVKILVEHPAINLNVKDRDENGAVSLCYPDVKSAKLMLETGRLNLDQDKAVVNLVHKENGTIEFELPYWQRDRLNIAPKFCTFLTITMNSEKSVQSIINKNTLFPGVNLLENVSEFDIKEGDEFLSACKTGDLEFVKKCLDSFNKSVLNRIDADEYGFTGLHKACYNAKLDVVKLLVDHQLINHNVKDTYGNSALYWCISKKELATVLLESGKLNIQGMNRVKNFAKSENESFQFELNTGHNYLIKMNSPTSLNSIFNLSTQALI